MMTFRKLAADSAGKLIRAYFTENTPESAHDFRTETGKQLDSGGRLTSYYTGRDGRATWRPDMAASVAQALGVDHRTMPKNEDLDRLFEAKRADTGEAWSEHKRKVSAYDLTLAPHKSVTLAAEFAATAAESAMIWHAIDRANDATMRYVEREVGWARKGKGGEEGADPGAVGWVSFRHHTARPTLPVQDGQDGATYLAQSPISGDPHAHIHNALFNMVVTDDGRIGSLDTQRLHSRVHEFGALFQARLADELRLLGARLGYDKAEQAVVLEAIPEQAVQTFSKGRRQVLGSAKAYAESQGLEWDKLSAEGKLKILSVQGWRPGSRSTAARTTRRFGAWFIFGHFGVTNGRAEVAGR
jgi:TrwC relaxase